MKHRLLLHLSLNFLPLTEIIRDLYKIHVLSLRILEFKMLETFEKFKYSLLKYKLTAILKNSIVLSHSCDRLSTISSKSSLVLFYFRLILPSIQFIKADLNKFASQTNPTSLELVSNSPVSYWNYVSPNFSQWHKINNFGYICDCSSSILLFFPKTSAILFGLRDID